MLQPDPFAAGDARDRFIIFKGNLYSIHWHIVEDDEIQNPRQQQHIDLPVSFQPGCNWNTVAAPRAPRRRIRFQEKTSFS